MRETFGGNKFAAELLARKSFAFDERDAEAVVCEPNSRACACRTGADDQNF